MARPMSRLLSRLAAGTAFAAALSLAAAPVSAAQLPLHTQSLVKSSDHRAQVSDGGTMAWHGRYRRDRGIDGGDVLAGVLILGGIAAIASAASSSHRETRSDYPYREPYPDQRQGYPAPTGYQGGSGGGIDNAVRLCTDQVDRGNARVASVDNAARTGEGWQISGQLDAGGQFSCWIDNDGRIRNVDLGGAYSGSRGPDDAPYVGGSAGGSGAAGAGQWNDDAYARARADNAYPGGDGQSYPGSGG